jgi:hypothetical protein
MSSIRSQAILEGQLQQRLAQVESRALTPEQAFANQDEWVVQLGERKAMLHPGLRQWLWFDRVHNEWAFAGCGVGEAILLTFDKLGGVKKLPQPSDVSPWCVYWQGQELFGPLPAAELIKKVQSKQVPPAILVWSPRASNWLTVAYRKADKQIYLRGATEQEVAAAFKSEAAPVAELKPLAADSSQKASPPQKKSNRNLIIAIVLIAILLCVCLPVLVGAIYVAKSAGFLPAALDGANWAPFLMQ